MSSVSAETVRMRLMPSRYVGDMCSMPSTSLPLLMRCRVAASVISAATWFSCRLVTHALEVGAAGLAPILAQEQLRAEERNELRALRVAERASSSRLSHALDRSPAAPAREGGPRSARPR